MTHPIEADVVGLRLRVARHLLPRLASPFSTAGRRWRLGAAAGEFGDGVVLDLGYVHGTGCNKYIGELQLVINMAGIERRGKNHSFRLV